MHPTFARIAILSLLSLTLPHAAASTTTTTESYVLGAQGSAHGEECGNLDLETNIAGVCFDFGSAAANRTANITVDDQLTENVLVRIQFGVYGTTGELVVSATGEHASLIHACGHWTGAVPAWAEGVRVAIYNNGHTELDNPTYAGCDPGVQGVVVLELTD